VDYPGLLFAVEEHGRAVEREMKTLRTAVLTMEIDKSGAMAVRENRVFGFFPSINCI